MSVLDSHTDSDIAAHDAPPSVVISPPPSPTAQPRDASENCTASSSKDSEPEMPPLAGSQRSPPSEEICNIRAWCKTRVVGQWEVIKWEALKWEVCLRAASRA